MAFEWIDSLLNGKQTKEAQLIPQGENKEDHFDRKIKASNWIADVSELDPVKVEAEYLAAQAAEARALGKKAAHEFLSDEEVLKADYNRQIKILSDYNLAEMLAEYRGQAENNLLEKFSELKEEAKKNVASGREKCETELLKLIGEHTHLDWKKAFDKFSKDAKVEQPKEADLYEPKAPEKAHDFEHPAEEKFKVPSDEKKADIMIGVGREADERTEATKEAGVVQTDITEGLGKAASLETEAHCGSCPGDPGHEQVSSPLKREELPVEVKAEICPICGGEGKDLANGEKDHLACMACGISYGHKEVSCGHCGGMEEIKSQASKTDILKKVAEISSPWKIIVDENGQECIARVEQPTNNKESEDEKLDLQK
jgi:hypothetical protein